MKVRFLVASMMLALVALACGNTPKKSGAMADARYEGIVGNALLEQFDVVFDFAACELWLKPNED